MDHALDLSPERALHWLASLPAENEHLSPRLRKLLHAHHTGACAGFMSGRPALDEVADEACVRPGDMVGPYRLLREAGRGGLCTVWLAEHTDIGAARQFAVKLPRRALDATLARRTADEREITMLMHHPNVAHLFDAGKDAANRPYLVLDYVHGQPVDRWCTDMRLGVVERLRLFVQVARAVDHVHGCGVVHRDLKPANVLVSGDGQVHVLDFGIARRLHGSGQGALPEFGERSLTPGYASPEQLRGEATNCRSDIYSLGVLLFELLTGQLPRQPKPGLLAPQGERAPNGAPPRASKLAQHAASASWLRGAVDAILLRALALRPEQRHASALNLAADVECHLAGLAPVTRPECRRRALSDGPGCGGRPNRRWRGDVAVRC